MSLGRTFTLNTGAKIPAIGLGTWQSKPNEVEKAVEVALKGGYRHIDCAAVYGNEQEVGRGIKNSGVPRDQIFVTSKLWNTNHSPEEVEPALDKTLKDLQLDYVDLYLIHWPCAFKHSEKNENFPKDEAGLIGLREIPYTETWKAMEKMAEKGKAKAIGVSNFTKDKVEEILKMCKIPPAANQIEAHPYLQQPELTEWSKSKNILIQAYSPLGNNIYDIPRVVDDTKVIEMGKKLNKDPAQILICWAVQRGTCVLPKSVTPSRIESNFQDFELPQDVMDDLDKMEKGLRMNYPILWGTDVFGDKGDDYCKQEAKKWREAGNEFK